MKNKWIKPGAKIIVTGDRCWCPDRYGEILKTNEDGILVRVVEEFWVNEAEIEEDNTDL